MEKLETIDYELDELYKINSIGSQGILVEHSSIDPKLQRDYIKSYFESKLKLAEL